MEHADVCFKIERSEDKKEGNKKYFYPVVGRAFFNEDGRVDIKLTSIPINWDGELVIFPRTPKSDAPKKKTAARK